MTGFFVILFLVIFAIVFKYKHGISITISLH